MPDNRHYLRRVVPEHRMPKFIKWLEANLVFVDDVASIINEMDSMFDIDNAIGIQQDITGDIVGVKRSLNFEPPIGLSTMLDDTTYKILQKAKISLNQWDGSMYEACLLLEELFPQYKFLLQDNQDMTLTFYTIGDPSVLEREFMARGYITPKPVGVRIRYDFILPDIEANKHIYTGGTVVADTYDIEIPTKEI